MVGGGLVFGRSFGKDLLNFFHERFGSRQRRPLRIAGNPTDNRFNAGRQPKDFSIRMKNLDVFFFQDESSARVDNQIVLAGEFLTHLRFKTAEMVPPELLDYVRNGLARLLDDFRIRGYDPSFQSLPQDFGHGAFPCSPVSY